LRAPLDPEPRGLAPQLGDGHRPSAGARALRSAALAGRRFGSFPTERRAGLLRQLGDGPLPPRSRLGLFDVLARDLALLLCRHPRLLALVLDFSPWLADRGSERTPAPSSSCPTCPWSFRSACRRLRISIRVS